MDKSEKVSKQIELCGKLCNWLVATICVTSLSLVINDEYLETEEGIMLAIVAVLVSVIYYLIVIYRHKHTAYLENNNSLDVYAFSNKMLKMQIFLSIAILVLFLFPLLEVFMSLYE